MVLEASLRREVACQGVLLQGAALSASLSQRSSPVTRITALVDATLTRAEVPWHDVQVRLITSTEPFMWVATFTVVAV